MYLRVSKFCLLLGDSILLYVSLFLTVRIGFWHDWTPEVFFMHLGIFSLIYPVWLVVFYIFDFYHLSVTPWSPRFYQLVPIAFLINFFLGVLIFYVLPIHYLTPKTNLIIHLVLFGGFFLAWRWWFFSRRRAKNVWRVGLFSQDKHTPALDTCIGRHGHLGYRTCFLDSHSSFVEQIKQQNVNMVILPSDIHQDVHQLHELYSCLGQGIVFFEPSTAYEFFDRRIPLSAVDEFWFLRYVQEEKHLISLVAKRCFDISASIVLLIVSLPLWLLMMFAIRVFDHGHVFYRQQRIGRRGNHFFIYKFRTMQEDAEKEGAQWARKNDPRVTTIGKFLRASHLDELPQMFNVLKGDISLVGPRPERPEFVSQLQEQIPHYHIRHIVQPGFTGWAQIRFRYARSITDSQSKFEYDLYYIKNRSFFFDLLILIKTVTLLFKKEE